MEKSFSQPSSRHRSPIRGFTLLEILIVIGIVVIVVALVITALSRAQVAARKTRAAGDLQAIATALEQYKSDHGDYPRVAGVPADPGYLTGAQILCRALIGPGDATADGADGPGFRVRRPQGRVYGPYLAADTFEIVNFDTPAAPLVMDKAAMADMSGNPILYFPASPVRPNINTVDGFIAPESPPTVRPLYDANDNLPIMNSISKMRAMLGDYDNNGGIDPGETAAHTGPFILWSAGEDGQYGPQSQSPTPTKAEVRACDDVINFPG